MVYVHLQKSKHKKKKHKKEEKSKEKKLPKHRDRGDEPQTESVQNGTLEEEPLPVRNLISAERL